MCHRYSVIAPELPIATSHHTRGRCAHRAIAGAAAIATAHIMTACPASSADGGVMLGSRCSWWPTRLNSYGPSHTKSTLTTSISAATAFAASPHSRPRR